MIENSLEMTNTITEEVGASVVELTLDGVRYVGAGSSKRCDPDSPDLDVGEKLALGRALKDLSKQLTKEAYDQVHEIDRERKQREEASRASRAAKAKAGQKFQEEFAELIEMTHPGTFIPILRLEKIKGSELRYSRAHLPA